VIFWNAKLYGASAKVFNMLEIDLRRTQGKFTLAAKCQIDSPVVGLFGPSGAGKSTLLAMIAGLVQPDAGYLLLDGVCLFDSKRRINLALHQRRIGTVFQDSRLFPHLNVADNLSYGLNLLAKKDQQLSFKKIVDLLEVGALLSHKPLQLSGGEKQRVALGRALLTSPRLLLLDEPLAALDMRLKHQILPFLRRIKDEIHMPMLYVSHAIDEILYLTTQIAMLDGGQLLAVGSFQEVMHDQRILSMAHSLGLENVLHTRIMGHDADHGYTTAAIANQQISLPPIAAAIGSQVSVSVAASNIALSINKIAGISIQNQLIGSVSTIQQLGSRMLVSVDIGAPLMVEVTAKALLDMQITLGSTVYCLIKTQSIHALPIAKTAQA
jgi:molybdate transport system ATP-binding protein